jgi:predicted AlkP superfamily pyrophosphatase or phosphodiesterase
MIRADALVLIAVDGLRPDALRRASTPHLDRLASRSSCTWAARTVMPSVTLPCHTSMFRGVRPERHGITTNVWVPPARPVPSLLDVLHRAKIPTTAIYNWEQLRDLGDPGSLDQSYFLNNCYEPGGDLELAELAAGVLAGMERGFAFVYLGYVDTVGHSQGWMSDPYLGAVAQADQAIGMILGELPPQVACIVTSDHGGHAQTHGTDAPEDMTIPWLISGPGIRQDHQIQGQVEITDNPPTIAALLGVEPAPEWTGRAIAEVFAGETP